MRNQIPQTEVGRNSIEKKALVLYRKLLDIMEREHDEIAEKKLDNAEHYMYQKVEILNEIETLKENKQWLLNGHAHNELTEIIKKIIAMNEANANAVRSIKSDIHTEISALYKSKSAHKAYNVRK